MNEATTPDVTPPIAAPAEPRRVKRELAELLATAGRVLPEYTDRLERMVQSIITVWGQREKRPDSLTQNTAVVVGRDLDVLQNVILLRIGREFLALSDPLRQWINKLSAVLEEGRLTSTQQMELRLRLTDLEVKFQTVGQLVKHLNLL